MCKIPLLASFPLYPAQVSSLYSLWFCVCVCVSAPTSPKSLSFPCLFVILPRALLFLYQQQQKQPKNRGLGQAGAVWSTVKIAGSQIVELSSAAFPGAIAGNLIQKQSQGWTITQVGLLKDNYSTQAHLSQTGSSWIIARWPLLFHWQ